MTEMLFTGAQVELDGDIVPVVALVAGVVNGEYVPAEVLLMGAGSWNGRPVTLGHPKASGQIISANEPAVLDRYELGRLYQVEVVDGKLKGWMHLNADRVANLEPELTAKIKFGPVEVSTGYYRVLDPTPGEHEGEAYNGVVQAIFPDHLAILPNEVGACSWRDGCGAPRTHEEADMDDVQEGAGETQPDNKILAAFRALAEAVGWSPATNEMSLGERLNLIVKAFRGMEGMSWPEGNSWVVEVFEAEAIVEKEDGLWSYPYALSDDRVVTFSAPTKVERVYQPIQAESESESESEPVEANEEEVETPPESEEESMSDEQVANQEAQPPDEFTALVKQYGGMDKVREMLEAAVEDREQRRAKLVDTIVANSDLTKDALGELSEAVLVSMAQALKPKDYSGTPAAQPLTEEQEHELPSMGI